MRYRAARPLPLLLGIVICCLGLGCSNSERIDNEVVAFWDIEEDATPLSTELNYLPIDDSEYPYAGIPRIVIETENHREIKDRETEIPAKLQVWGADAPESEVMELTIRGRGNSSWTHSPKKSYKIKFNTKESLFGIHKDREWALIANYADKSMLKNYISYKLFHEISDTWNPQIHFIELYLNNNYQGIYAFTETIKKTTHRVAINDNDFLLEIDAKTKANDQTIYVDGFTYPFKIHWPKNANEKALKQVTEHLDNFQKFISSDKVSKGDEYSQWIDAEKFTKYFWLQEFSKNLDAYYTSSFLIVRENGLVEMGPLWDMDAAYGYPGWDVNATIPTDGFRQKKIWLLPFFKNKSFSQYADSIWKEMSPIIKNYADSITSIGMLLEHPYVNEEKKWHKLESSLNPLHHKGYSSYTNAYTDFRNWYINRLDWLDKNSNKLNLKI